MTDEARNDELRVLCSACGMCCDGSLFGRVPLAEDEVAGAKRLRLRVVPSGRAFEQPCSALVHEGGSEPRSSCSLYAERPRACAAFACRLHDRHQRERGPLEPRLAAVRRVRELVATLEAAGASAADFDEDAARMRARGAEGAELALAFAELSRRLEEDFARASETT